MTNRVILDTTIVILAVRADETILAHLARHPRKELATTAITLAELEYGSRLSHAPAIHRAAWQAVLRNLPVLSFTREEAPEHARLRDLLREHPIGERDLLIAAIAVTHRCAVATRNAGEFRRVRGLKVVGWG